jgi:GH43 family beta-xylosidase
MRNLAHFLLLVTVFYHGSVHADQWYVNPIAEGADPWVVRDPNADRFLWCAATGNQSIAIHTSDSLVSMGNRHVIWVAPETGPFSKEVWAPELHFLDGHWHVYFAASDGKNANHLAYVLRSTDSDPLGTYQLHGPFATGEGTDGLAPNIWAIDMTVLEHGGRRYAIWSGWDAPGTDRQFLYIAPMKSPLALSGPRVQLCDNDDFAWEVTEPGKAGRGLNEGPQVLDTGERTFVIYSCGASWLPTYKLGRLELVGDDPLKPESWIKSKEPAFTGNRQIHGVGHSCFVKSDDGEQWWHVFHSKLSPEPGWHRGIFVQPMTIDRTGAPEFGEPLPAGKKMLVPLELQSQP